MSQNIIDTGQAANDGTGEPLRQAFTAINDNFSNIWAQGPVDSQVVISNNTVTTNETNLDLVLSANGIGNVTVNSTVIPGVNSIYDLGAANAQFDTVWARYYQASSGSFSGDVTVDGNLIVAGNIIQVGNIVTDSLTIQLGNTVTNAAGANGAGITVGANDNIATILYNSTSNTWNTNIGLSSAGNIAGNYFIGNGALLTGLPAGYANSNAVAYANAGWAGNIIPATSNVYSLGNATNQWNDLYVSNTTIYMNNVPISLTAGNVLTVDGEPVLVNDSNTSITTTGNITADNFFGSGVTAAAANDVVALNAFDAGGNTVSIQAQGNTAAAVIETYFEGANNRWTWSFDNSGTLTFPRSQTSIFGGYDNDFTINTSNTGNATYTFTFSQFGDLSVPVNLDVSGNVYTNDIVGPSAGNVAITANTQSWLFDNNGTITLPGNSQILPAGNTGVRLSAGASDATGLFLNNTGDAELYANSNVSVYTDGGNIGWTFDNTGNLALPNNGSINFAAGGIVQAADENFTILVQDADDDDFSVYLNVDDGAGTILSSYRQQRDRYQLTFSTGNDFQFNDNGTLVLPPNAGVWTDAYSNVSIIARSVTDTSFVEMMTQDNSDIKRSNVTVTRDNVTVTTSSGGYNWTFGVDGNLTLPGAINLAGNTGVIESSANSVSIYSDSSQLNGILFYGDGAGNDGVDIYAAQGLAIFANNAGDSNETRFLQNGSISMPNKGFIYSFTGGDNGGLTLYDTDNNNRAQLAAIGNINLRSDSNNAGSEWIFDTTGNLTIPKNILGPNNGNPIVIDAGATGDSFISIPSFTDGGEQLVIKNRYGSSQGIRLETETGNFVISGNSITFPDSTVQSTAYTGAIYGDSNVTTLLSSLGANTISGTGNITTTANISGGYVLGNAAFMTGIPASYGNANVATFLAAYGSNTISTTGNVTSGNLITAGSVNVAGNVNLTGAEGSDTARIFTDVSGSDTSLVLEVGDDNGDDIVLRHYSFAASTALDMLTATRVSNTAANISVAGNLNAVGGTFSGNVTADNFVGNISLLGNVTGTSSNVTLVAGSYSTVFDNTGTATFPGAMQLAVYANTTVRDSSITSPQPGMMIYVSGTGMQVRGATSWNTIAGSGT